VLNFGGCAGGVCVSGYGGVVGVKVGVKGGVKVVVW